MYYGTQDKLKAYGSVGLSSEIMEASPHRLIQMLMAGALEKIAIAKNHYLAKSWGEMGHQISWAISIIDGLRISLDRSFGSEVAENLNDLYEYMSQRLLQANVEKNSEYLDEVMQLLRTIKSGWDEIPEADRTAHQNPEHYLRD